MIDTQPLLHKPKSVILIYLNDERLLQIDLLLFFLSCCNSCPFLCELMEKSSICLIRNNSAPFKGQMGSWGHSKGLCQRPWRIPAVSKCEKAASGYTGTALPQLSFLSQLWECLKIMDKQGRGGEKITVTFRSLAESQIRCCGQRFSTATAAMRDSEVTGIYF